MNTTKAKVSHTPGEWQISNDGIVHNGNVPIAQILRPNGYESDDEANARLIAAAPELLEACKAIMECDTPTEDMGGDWGSVEWCEWVGQAIEKAKAAIAKAEGEK